MIPLGVMHVSRRSWMPGITGDRCAAEAVGLVSHKRRQIEAWSALLLAAIETILDCPSIALPSLPRRASISCLAVAKVATRGSVV